MSAVVGDMALKVLDVVWNRREKVLNCQKVMRVIPVFIRTGNYGVTDAR